MGERSGHMDSSFLLNGLVSYFPHLCCDLIWIAMLNDLSAEI